MSIYSETLNGRNGGGKGWGAVRELTEGRGLHDETPISLILYGFIKSRPEGRLKPFRRLHSSNCYLSCILSNRPVREQNLRFIGLQ